MATKVIVVSSESDEDAQTTSPPRKKITLNDYFKPEEDNGRSNAFDHLMSCSSRLSKQLYTMGVQVKSKNGLSPLYLLTK